MRGHIFSGVALVASLASQEAWAGDISLVAPTAAAPSAWASPAPYPNDWDKRIGYDFWTRLVNYYALEMGHDAAPPDPSGDQTQLRGQPADGGALQLLCGQGAQ